MESVYIHIPFCKKICTYCDFCKMFAFNKFINPYLKALKDEINDKYHGEIIKTLYIGGGTPSCLNASHLTELFNVIKLLNLSEDYEFTFECNLGDLNEELLTFLKAHGVNRLSIGIQSFNTAKLQYMGRNHTFEEAFKSLEFARNIGIDSINIDLIYGIPGESINDLKKDLALILKLNPTHISTYSLIIEKNTKIEILGEIPIAEDLDAKMYEYIIKILSKKNFVHYEISNFALPGFESKHNLKYWANEEYYGFGLGAHGYIYGIRYENTRSYTEYIKGKYLLQESIMSKTEMMENELMLGLRRIRGVSLQEFFDKYGVNMQDVFPIKPLIKNKDLIYKNGYISINPDKIYIMNEILLKLI